MKTEVAKAENVVRDWYIVDAQDAVLGRLSTQKKIALTGRKLADKIYYSHSGYVGGLKEITAGKLLEKKPEDLIKKAVKGMLPKNKLARAMLSKLKIYAGPSHPHAAQQPKNLAL